MFTIKLDQFEREENPDTDVTNLEHVAILAVIFNIEPYEIEVYTFYGGKIVFKYDSSYIDVIEHIQKFTSLDSLQSLYRYVNMRSILNHQLTIANMIEKEYAAREDAEVSENAAN